MGEIVQVTHFHDPSLMVAAAIAQVGLSVYEGAADGGSIWMLDNVDR